MVVVVAVAVAVVVVVSMVVVLVVVVAARVRGVRVCADVGRPHIVEQALLAVAMQRAARFVRVRGL